MSDFRPARRRVEVTVGESVRIIRELQGLSQNQLSQSSGIPQATISAIKNDRVRLGVERAMISMALPGGRLLGGPPETLGSGDPI